MYNITKKRKSEERFDKKCYERYNVLFSNLFLLLYMGS